MRIQDRGRKGIRKVWKYESHSGDGKEPAVKDTGRNGYKTYYGQNQRNAV